jgi:hemerythrin-like metal-binding protein
MLPPLRWLDGFTMGIAEIDDDHHQLIDDAESISALIYNARPWSEVVAMVELMAERCSAHFRREEQILARDRFPHHEAHRQEHARIEREIVDVVSRVQSDVEPTPAMIEAALYFRGMLIDHLLRYDLAYKSHLLYARGK